MNRVARSPRSLLPGAIVCATIVFITFVVMPLHARGVMQPVLCWPARLNHLLELPGRAVVYLLGGGLTRPGHVSTATWFLGFGFNTVFYLSLSAGWYERRYAREWFRRRKTTPDSAPETPPDPSRRHFLKTGGMVAAAGVAGVAGWSFVVEPQLIGVSRRVFAVRGLHPSLAGLRIVHLTDIHLGPWSSPGFVEGVVRQTNALNPDVILLTGDYVHQSARYIGPVIELLAGLRPRIGMVGTLGNHDWWEDGPRAQREFRCVGIPLVDNARMFLTPDRRLVSEAGEGLCLAGVGDLWTDRVDFERALHDVPPSMPRLLLSHNPDVAEDARLSHPRHRVDLMLSGHTHGGQIRIPILGSPVVPSRYGQKYAQGLVQGPSCPVFISRGVGMTLLPLRLACPPEIAVIELAAG